jgi:hypothetical protein
MRNGLLILLVATLTMSGCTMWKESPAHAWKEITGGESLEQMFWQELKAKNWNEIEQRLAGNFVAITPHGQLDRAAFLDHLKQLQLDDYSLGEMQVELNTQTLVVTYVVTLRGAINGQPISSPLRMMSVWQKQNAGWIQIAHTVITPG